MPTETNNIKMESFTSAMSPAEIKYTESENKLWNSLLVADPITVPNTQKGVARHVITTLAKTHKNLDNFSAYQATAHSVRDQLIKRWNDTQNYHTEKDQKRVYYLSMEFLIGRSLDNAILNMEVKGVYKDAMRELGFNLEKLVEEEQDAALGNGGLGRLAACFMDSLATMDYAAWGYGLRYSYGIFQQRIIDGYQCEFPDYWLTYDNPWELARHDIIYEVRFYGHISHTIVDGKKRSSWEGGEIVEAVGYDVPIPGYKTKNTINIRLWRSVPKKKFDLTSFNEGNYQKSVEESMRAENITSVLYPNDNTMAGKELRLKQQ
jgi:starch phosphorylase